MGLPLVYKEIWAVSCWFCAGEDRLQKPQPAPVEDSGRRSRSHTRRTLAVVRQSEIFGISRDRRSRGHREREAFSDERASLFRTTRSKGLSASARLLSAYVGRLPGAGFPFESRPPTAPQQHLTPPQPRQTGAGGKPRRRRPLPPARIGDSLAAVRARGALTATSRSGSRPLGARRARHTCWCHCGQLPLQATSASQRLRLRRRSVSS